MLAEDLGKISDILVYARLDVAITWLGHWANLTVLLAQETQAVCVFSSQSPAFTEIPQLSEPQEVHERYCF